MQFLSFSKQFFSTAKLLSFQYALASRVEEKWRRTEALLLRLLLQHLLQYKAVSEASKIGPDSWHVYRYRRGMDATIVVLPLEQLCRRQSPRETAAMGPRHLKARAFFCFGLTSK